MNRYYISLRNKNNKLNAGSKAVNDCEKIFEDNGYKIIELVNSASNNILLGKFIFLISSFKLFKINKNDIVLLEHPFYPSRVFIGLIGLYKKIRRFSCVLFIHDLNSLRFKDVKIWTHVDKTALRLCDKVVAHNEEMKKYIVSEYGIDNDKIIVLGLFDYLVKGQICNGKKQKDTNSIVIAGSLYPEKAGYVYKLNEEVKGITMYTYGVGLDKDKFSGSYCGSYPPDILPDEIKGGYGLVWDGDSLDECAGTIGEYLKYNNPHKTSLYLASGIPVIIWDKAALADFIKNNNCGITVASLKDICNIISRISDEEYAVMKKNAIEIGNRLRQGDYTRRVLKQLE
jgi:hypothetical protein